MVAEEFYENIWGVEPLGDELVKYQETVLSLSKNFPARHSALHGSGPVPRKKGAASEPAASQLLKPSPACQQFSSQQVPSPALHRCSTGAEQSLAAAPATPSLPTGQNFIFPKKNCQNTQCGEKPWSKLKKNFMPLNKNIYIWLKNIPRAYLAGPPLQKSHTVLACPRFRSSMRNLFSVQLLRPLFSSQMVSEAKTKREIVSDL
jgi:hypothetical protein